MAINIQNLLSAATAKIGVAAVDAADSARLASLTNFVNNHRNTQTFASFASLPTADSSNFGQIVRVAADSAGTYLDSGSTFYVSYVNQWKQVLFSGDSDVTQFAPAFQGRNFGYTSGGKNDPTVSNVIDKFPFASDANASDVGDLTAGRYRISGNSSAENGYTVGGLPDFTPGPAYYSTGLIIDKFPFASDGNATDVGDITVSKRDTTGQSSSENGYVSGGRINEPNTTTNVIEKFPFATDANATDVGDLSQGRYGKPAGQSSTDNGYTSGGHNTVSVSTVYDIIDKFSFSSDGNATDVGDLTVARYGLSGQSSTVSGYSTAGRGAPPSAPYTNIIDKFPFASDANATEVGDVSSGRYIAAGQSSTDNGYASGGGYPATNNAIEKFPFASDGNASDVGDLTVTRRQSAGQQY